MAAIEEICSVCRQSFEMTFRYQMEERDGGFAFYCSQACLERSHGGSQDSDTPQVTCDACAKRFGLGLASQVLYSEGRRRYACGMACRNQLVREASGARLQEFAAGASAPAAPRSGSGPSRGAAIQGDAATSSQRPERAPTEEDVHTPRDLRGADRRSSSGSRADRRSSAAGVGRPAEKRPLRNGWVRLERDVAEELKPRVRPSPAADPSAVAVPTAPASRRTRHPSPSDGRDTPIWPPRRIAVFNHKGGTGKTTTSVSLAAGLAAEGKRVLLVDTDSQGNVAVSLGKSAERSLYHVLVMGLRVSDATSEVRPGLDLLPSNETLAAAELYLAGRQNRDRVLSQRMDQAVQGYDYVIIDCSPSLSLMNQNALVFADSVLVPVACDYLSLVGVRQVIKTVRNVNHLLHHRLQIWGVLPTFYDVRAKICAEALKTLRNHFGERCLPPVRATTRLKEAPARAQPIFEYAPGSHGADDYRDLVARVLAGSPAATVDVVPSGAGRPPRHSSPGLGPGLPAVATA